MSAYLSGAPVYALDFPPWKRAPLRLCLPGLELRHVRDVAHLPDGATLIVWGATQLSDEHARRLRLLRVEDGFIRSKGLGAELARPISWVIDSRGIYFDSQQPSDLEVMLSEGDFSSAELARARRLRAFITEAGLTKYNVGGRGWQRPRAVQRVILVPGQVEDDASIVLGSPVIKTNLKLLQAVRQRNPDAYVVYKPHPDVQARFRSGGDPSSLRRWCDAWVADVRMDQLLTEVDEVHCLTSLTGFEALLRGNKVVCYGQPFYAGWGLTVDVFPHERRGRRRSLDELVAAALLRYPRYFSLRHDGCVSPEEALQELAEACRSQREAQATVRRRLWRALIWGIGRARRYLGQTETSRF